MSEGGSRLWIINHYAVPPTVPGGTRHFDLAKDLAKRDWDVTIFASGFRHRTRQAMEFEGKTWWRAEEIDGVRFIWIRTSWYRSNDWRRIVNMLVFSWRVSRLGFVPKKLGHGKPAVIIGSSVHLFAVFSAWLLSRRHRAPFVMEVRDLWPQTLVDVGRASAGHPLILCLRALERFLYRRADRIITLLPGAESYLTRNGASSAKIVWIPNGVDLSDKPPLRAGPPADRFTVMYVGAHGPANCLNLLLDVAAEVARRSERIRFVLVGDGPEKETLVREAGARGLTNVEFRPPIPKRQVFDALKESDATIVLLEDLPIYRYGISLNKLYDYLAAGRPTVFVGRAFNDPVADSGGGVAIRERSAAAIAERLVELSDAPASLLEAYGARGRRYIEQHHSIKTLAKRLEDEVLVPLTSDESGGS